VHQKFVNLNWVFEEDRFIKFFQLSCCTALAVVVPSTSMHCILLQYYNTHKTIQVIR